MLSKTEEVNEGIKACTMLRRVLWMPDDLLRSQLKRVVRTRIHTADSNGKNRT